MVDYLINCLILKKIKKGLIKINFMPERLGYNPTEEAVKKPPETESRPEQREAEAGPTFEVLKIPSLKDEKASQLEFIKKEADQIPRVEENLKYLDYLADKIEAEEAEYRRNKRPYYKSGIGEKYKLLQDYYDAYSGRIKGYHQAKDANEVTGERVGNLKTMSETESATDGEILAMLKNDFENSPGNKVGLTDSHVHTIFELTEAYKARENKDAQVGVFVFDNHVDLYTNVEFYYPGSQEEQEKAKAEFIEFRKGFKDSMTNEAMTDQTKEEIERTFDKETLDIWKKKEHQQIPDTKANVFQQLYSKGMIEKATFIGGRASPNLIKSNNERLSRSGEAVFEQISADDIRTDDKLDREKLIAAIKKSVNKYKESGITNIVFSVDIDVLRVSQMGYTAMEYTPMNTLSYLAKMDLPTDKKYEDLSIEEVSAILSSLDNTKLDNDRTRASGLRGERETYDPRGMALGDLGVSLDTIAQECQANDMTLGLQLKGDGNYLGDVVELGGPDYGERTTKAVSALLERIHRISDSQPEPEDKEVPVAA